MFYNFHVSNGLGDAAKEEILRNGAALKQSDRLYNQLVSSDR